VAGELADHIASAGARDLRLQNAARMDVCFVAATALALDVCTGTAVSGPAAMRLILAVFGIAGILLLVWIVLWLMASRSRN
jgi:hypothetical protein